MTQVTIRCATFEDVEAITVLTRAAYAKWVEVIGREPLPMRVDYAAAFETDRFDMLFEGDALAGLVQTVVRNPFLLIENIAVDPACQRRGYGRKLLAHTERLAVSSGLGGTRLYTNARFVENIRLYESLGYTVEREEALNGGVAIHMAKRLA